MYFGVFDSSWVHRNIIFYIDISKLCQGQYYDQGLFELTIYGLLMIHVNESQPRNQGGGAR